MRYFVCGKTEKDNNNVKERIYFIITLSNFVEN